MTGAEGLRISPDDALILDLDGTLAEIVQDPAAVRLPPDTHAALGRLALRLGGAVALLSGRDLRDLASRTPDTVWRLGGHGLEVLAIGVKPPPPLAPPPDAVLAPLRAVARDGVRLEIKGPIMALHYRQAPGAEAGCVAAAQAAAKAAPGLKVQQGKMVVEVKPLTADKGRAVEALMRRAPFAGRRPVVWGDDATDEDAMRAALAMGGTAVKVGEGESLAPYRLPDPAAARAWLAREADAGPG